MHQAKRKFPFMSFSASSFLDQTSIKITDGGKIAVKKYTKPSGIIKWLILNFPPIPLYYPLTLDPFERMKREVTFFSTSIDGISVPKIYKVDWDNALLEREYVDGKILSLESEEEIILYGRGLSYIHGYGACLGDTKPQNYLTEDDDIYIIDAEQSLFNCSKKRYMGWDLALSILFIFWADPFVGPQEFSAKFSSFKRGYEDKGLKITWDLLTEAHPVIFLIPPQLLLVIKNSID
ncbi:MAG: hypothetical protein GU347_02585 [Desulfurococcales archaeon]|nr:hypothetical protein [Desulfurococcales archaeon]